MHPARDGGNGLKCALSARIKEELAVLPIGHGCARLKALMAHVRRQKRLVQHERGILEAGVHVAIGPLVGRMSHGHASLLFRGEVSFRPLQHGQLIRSAP